MSKPKEDIALLTPERLEDFLKHLEERGRKEATIRCYREVLMPLASSLPDGRLVEDTWPNWKRELENKGLQPATVNKSLTALNSYLKYIGHRELQRDDFAQTEKKAQPELSRDEYHRLLTAAKLLDKENAYLLLKLMGSFGVELKDLPLVTVEAVKAGRIKTEGGAQIAFTRELQRELLDYAQRKGITTGLVFRTGTGRLMDRKHIHWLLSSLCQTARVDEEKAGPKIVLRMYQRTRDEIQERIARQAERDFQQMLYTEQRLYGWEEDIDGSAGTRPARRNDLNLAR